MPGNGCSVRRPWAPEETTRAHSCTYLWHGPALSAVEVKGSPFDCLDSKQIQIPRMTSYTYLGHRTLLGNPHLHPTLSPRPLDVWGFSDSSICS